MSRSKNRKIADLISGGTFDDGVVAASEVTGLHSVASTGNFNELSNKPAPFDPATLASVAVSGSFNDLSNQPTPFDPSTLATVATSGAYSALSGKPSIPSAGTTPNYSSAPSIATEGSMYYHTTEDQLYVSDGTEWTPILVKAPVTTGGTITLPTAALNTSYSYNFGSDVSDGAYSDDELSYSLQSGTVPAGLSIAQNITGSSTSLDTGTYNFVVFIRNPSGASAVQSYTMTAAGIPSNTSNGQAAFTSNGTWTVPAGVYNFSVVAVGAGSKGGDYAGGGGGGALAFTNTVVTSPSEVWSIEVGVCDTSSYPNNTGGGHTRMYRNGIDIVKAGGAPPIGTTWNNTATNGVEGLGAAGGVVLVGTGGGNGGRGGKTGTQAYQPGGGGGAGGYSGAGGNGADDQANGTSGSGGGGGGGGKLYNHSGYSGGAGGGGVGLNGQGASGAGGNSNPSNNSSTAVLGFGGGGGSGGASAPNQSYNISAAAGGSAGGVYGGGGGANTNNGTSGANGANGALRIVWRTGDATSYSFPSTNVN